MQLSARNDGGSFVAICIYLHQNWKKTGKQKKMCNILNNKKRKKATALIIWLQINEDSRLNEEKKKKQQHRGRNGRIHTEITHTNQQWNQTEKSTKLIIFKEKIEFEA